MTDKESRRKLITEKRREQILKAAMEIFSRKGYATATIPEIARAAGIAAGTIYLYYASKRELFIAVIKSLVFTPPLLNLIDRIPKENIAIILKNILRNRFDLLKSEPMTKIPSLIGEIQRDPELKTIWVEQFLHPFLARIEGIYSGMAASGKIRRMEPAVVVRAIGGLFFGFFILRLLEGEVSPLNRLPQDKVADDMVNFILHGLLQDAGAKKSRLEDTL